MSESTAERRIEYVALSELQRAPKNPKGHKHDDIEHSISRFGYVEPIVIDERTGKMVAGHGRLETLERMRAAGVTPPEGVAVKDGEWLTPVLRGWSSKSDAEAEAYLLASNQLTIAGGFLEEELKSMLVSLAESDPSLVEGLGWSEKELQKLTAPAAPSQYTDKIKAPVYQPTQEKPPPVSELYDSERRRVLCQEIDEAEGVTEEERVFLRMAAQRHVVFDYQAIAEYYAHASAPMQELMEKSALVIIDFEKAIEEGFVELTEGLAADLMAEEGEEAA